MFSRPRQFWRSAPVPALLLCSLFASVGLLRAQSVPFDASLYMAAFDHAWRTVRDKHWDPGLNGVDWEAAWKELRPRMEKAGSAAEARGVIASLIDRLGESHFAVIPADIYEAVETPDRGVPEGSADAGFEIRFIDSEAVVVNVRPGSPAEQAGVKPGWALRRVGSTDIAPLLPQAAAAPTGHGSAATAPAPHLQSSLRAYMAVRRRLQSRGGESLTYVFDTGGKRPGTTRLELRHVAPPGRLVSFGHLPPMHLNIERRRLDEVTGYLRLSSFFDPVWLQEELSKLVEECRSCLGIIVDVRGNPGGISILAPAVVGWFVAQPVSLGTYYMRGVTLKLAVNPRPQPFAGKLAILVDGLSMSTAEFLAGGAQDIGRGRIFGEPTPGVALPSIIEKLPTGDGLQYVMANYISAGGKRLEGSGVTPDQLVPLRRATLLEGRDAVLEAAQRWILKGE
jgi:carboxyl-terminal processing protease